MPNRDSSPGPAADFRDDGGAPAFRARQRAARWAPYYLVLRFLWLFPLVAFGAAFVSAFAWLFLTAVAGEPFVRSIWWMVLLFGFVTAWDVLVKHNGGLGRGPLWFSGMVNSPTPGPVGDIATYFRSVFVLAYGFYVVIFWFIAGVAVWAWESGAWERAVGG